MIGERIKTRRLELGMSQEELARKLGYKAKSSITKIEYGINDIPQSKIVKFAAALDTTPAYLLGWESSQDARLRIYQKRLSDLYEKLERLDPSDLARIDERVDTMLEAYTRARV